MDIILDLVSENIEINSCEDLGFLYEVLFPGKALDIPLELNFSSWEEEDQH